MLRDRIEALLRETYALWEPGWVTFNWRNYTYDHVQRVRGLALTLCRAEGGDERIVELAALLHDLTKPYDGEYLTDSEGKRLVDERGFWRNALRPPVRRNLATDLYDRLGLAGALHNESGAVLAEVLLTEWGIEADLAKRVAGAIRDHLLPPEGAPIESTCLYDADTIDANIGLPALVRNIYINLHFYDARRADGAPSLDKVLSEAPLDFLRPYITENLPRWNAGKRRDFLPKLRTASGRRMAETRLARLEIILGELAHTLEHLDGEVARSPLGVILHYMHHREEPSIAAETAYLARRWLTNGAPEPTKRLITALQQEMEGVW